jgi:SAM-dependent methyltransferase
MKTLVSCQLCESGNIASVDDECNIFKCVTCGFYFDNPRPSFEEILHYYSLPTKYNLWLENLGVRESLWRKRLDRMRRWKKKGSLLDIGTGIGQLLYLARDDFSEIYGTEISGIAINIAKDRYSLDIYNGVVEEIDFSGKKFDNISLFHVLEHVEDPKRLIRRCHSLLHENGMLYIAVPNDILSLKGWTKRMMRKLGYHRRPPVGRMGLQKIALDGSVAEIHLSHFTTAVLTEFLKREKFDICEISLDPYFIGSGFRGIIQGLYYSVNLAVFRIFRTNLYDTIWIVASKRQ